MRTAAPYHSLAVPVPVPVRPIGGECSGSYILRLAAANRCDPWSLLSLLGKIAGGPRKDWLAPEAIVSLNERALDRLSRYAGRPTNTLLRAIPEIGQCQGDRLAGVYLRRAPEQRCEVAADAKHHAA